MFPEDRWGSRCTTAEEGGRGFRRRGLVAGEGVVSTEREGASGLGCWGAEAQGLVGGCPFVRTRCSLETA